MDLIMTEAERRVEAKCDEERYWALHHKEDQDEQFREEELKRLQMALKEKEYSSVQYSYDDNSQNSNSNPANNKEDEEDDTPFVAPPELDIPVNMVLPPNQKQHAIIEKTAQFIAQQGGQMEVLLKAKQAGNPQFCFLSFNDELHPYYKLVLMAIRNNRYKVMDTNDSKKDESSNDDSDGEHYLHPSLARTTIVDSAPSIPSVVYRPSADCAYSMLVSKIKGVPIELGKRPPVEDVNKNKVVETVAPKEEPIAPTPVMPDAELQVVVDKIASYVAKNGPEFEAVVRSKGDPRFAFLDPNHIYHLYYQQRTQHFVDELQPKQNSKNKAPLVPVSFSIKAQAPEGVLEKRSVLDLEAPRPRAAAAYMATALQSVSDVPLPPCPPPEAPEINKEEEERRQAAKKLAEERLRAKLMAVAREKMANVNKEKQVQQERKKKVAAFLSKLALEKRQIIKPTAPVIIGPQLPLELQPPEQDDDVRSIPSPSPQDKSLSPPPAPTIRGISTPPPAPIIGGNKFEPSRHKDGPSYNGNSKSFRRSRSPGRHSHHKRNNSSSRHHRRKRSSSRGRRHGPSSQFKHKKRSQESVSKESRDVKKHKRRRKRSSSSSSSSSSSRDSKSRSNSRERS
ncbi:splicing factor, suppressor of white-apricot homolog isoform X2 [Neocloeon triangulifer]|nr:splicing factor, suppressor of white-apricot homolog isoform X2 [Neocloeon triangulifer]